MVTQADSPRFTWIPFYERLADVLAAYRDRQPELIAFLEELRVRGFTVTPLEDKEETGRRFLLEEIDPFTFFGTFNRGIGDDKRIGILGETKKFFDIEVPAPSDFSGIPVLNNMKSWFFSYRARRQPADVDKLWEVFQLALGPDPLSDSKFAVAFDRALEVRSTNVNLTMGLFWVRPRRLLSVDARMRAHLSIRLPSDGLSFAFYRDTVARLRVMTATPFPDLSFQAWTGTQNPPPPPPDADYWLVGAYWDGAEPQDQTDRFLAEGIWENGYEDRYLDMVRQMKTGDRIAIKAATTQRTGLPFDNRGATVSRMVMKARGTIVRNRGDGRLVEVEWEARREPRDWYFYTGRSTVWRLQKDQDLARRLIGFVFFDEPQDHAFFVETWLGSAPLVVQENDVDIVPAYSAADLIAEGGFLREEEIRLAVARLKAKGALILQGAPGVGKTFVARKLAYVLMEARDPARVTTVQFHPSYSYEDFVRGYRPTAEAGRFELRDGPFMAVCDRAQRDPDRRHILIVDEINRGHLSQVFGELFMLLEADKRGREHGVTPLYRRADDETFFVPKNLFVIGTMNLADRSLALVDFALRRRFAFVTLEPRFGDPAFRRWVRERKMRETVCDLIIHKMGALNAQIAADPQLGPAFRIGHSFFCPPGDDFSGLDEAWFRQIIQTEIVPLLEEYWSDAPGKAKSAADELLG